MCGRYAVFMDPSAFESAFGVSPPDGHVTYNAAPGQSLPVVRADGGCREAATPEWGFVPAWADDDREAHVNARAETVREKPSFRDAVRERRCLVPANGFYEWREEDGRAQPYYFERADGDPFAMAGVWSRYTPETAQTGLDAFGSDGNADTEGGADAANAADAVTAVEAVETFAVLTRTATGSVADYHHREAVVVAPERYADWLSGDAAVDAVAASRPAFSARPVSTAVNSPATDRPGLIRRQ